MAKFPTQSNGMVTGLLWKSEKREVAEKLKEKGAPRPCEACGTNKWSVGDYIVTPEGLARYPDGTLSSAPGDPIHPSILLFCDNCGNTKIFNSLLLGVDLMSGGGSND